MAAWTYSDWVTLTDVSAKLTQLRLHIQEVSNRLANPSYQLEGLSVNPRENLGTYLASLKDDLKELEQLDASSRIGWTRGHASL